MTCPICSRAVGDHDLEEAWVCLDAAAEATAALAARACGGATPAMLERETRRPSLNWRSTRSDLTVR